MTRKLVLCAPLPADLSSALTHGSRVMLTLPHRIGGSSCVDSSPPPRLNARIQSTECAAGRGPCGLPACAHAPMPRPAARGVGTTCKHPQRRASDTAAVWRRQRGCREPGVGAPLICSAPRAGAGHACMHVCMPTGRLFHICDCICTPTYLPTCIHRAGAGTAAHGLLGRNLQTPLTPMAPPPCCKEPPSASPYSHFKAAKGCCCRAAWLRPEEAEMTKQARKLASTLFTLT